MKINLLAEDTAKFYSFDIKAENGLSFFIKFRDKHILFDLGQSRLFLDNANLMGVNIHKVDHIVLSHGHYDHSGGLKALVNNPNFRNLPLIGHTEVFEKKLGKNDFEIGSPIPKRVAENNFDLQLSQDRVEISPKIMFTGEIPTTYEEPINDGKHYEDGKLKPDYLKDEGALVFNTDEGLVIFTGCSHPGIINIIRYAIDLFDNENILAVIGGFHLINADQDRLKSVIQEFKNLNVGKVFPCHCTGYQASYQIAQELNAEKLNSGDVLELPV